MGKLHAFIRCWCGLALASLSFAICVPHVEASVAPLWDTDNAGDNDSYYWVCPAGGRTWSILIPANASYSQRIESIHFFAKAASATVAPFDVFFDIREGTSPTSTVVATYSYTPTISTTAMTEYTIDIPSPFWDIDVGTPINITVRLAGAGSCISSNYIYLRGSTANNSDTMSVINAGGTWLDADGFLIYAYGEEGYVAYVDVATSTDPYAYFDAYASSSYSFTDPDFGWFGNAILDVLKYLFVGPFDAVKSWFLTQIELAKYRTPQGYLTRFFEMHQDVAGDFTSASTTELVVSIPLPGQATSTGTIIDPAVAEDVGVPYDDWRDISVNIIWIVALWKIFDDAIDFVDSLRA